MSELCFSRFKRGQIWKIFKSASEAKRGMEDRDNHLQEKTRTWLIISVDVSNDNAPILNCVPMTSRLRELPCHVKVTMEKCECMVLCEHITTINKADLESAQFIGILNEFYMKKVEIALANQLGLSIQIPSAEALKQFVEKLANLKSQDIKARSQEVTDDYVLDLATKLETVFGIESSKEVPKTDVKENPIKVPTVRAPRNTPTEPRKNNKWTMESMKQFLDDCDKLSSQQLCEKYSTSPKSVYTYKGKFRALVNESKQG